MPIPNVIKSATTLSNGSIKRNNFLIGVDNTYGYGPTDNGVVIPAVDVTSTRTFFWNGISTPPGGYVIYIQKASGGPSIISISGDTALINAARQNGGTNINTVNDALVFFSGQTNYLVTNLDYPSIVTSGLTVLLDGGFVPSYSRTGSTWNDISGNNNNGTLINAPTFSSIGGGSFLLNGTTQSANLSSLNLLQNFTIETWVRQNVLSGFGIFGQGTTATNNGLHVLYLSNTSIRFGMFSNDTDFTVSTTTGVWYHLAITYLNSSPFTKALYINGVAQSGVAQQTQASYTGSGTFRLGATYSSGGNFGNGYFAGLKAYNRILTPTEILQNYNAQVSRYSLVLYWDIANSNSYPGTGTTITDLSGNGVTGTLTGGVSYNTNNGGVLTTNGTTGYITSSALNLASTNYTVIGASRYNGATRGRMINATSNNWLLGQWGNSTTNYYAEGWITNSGGSGGSDTTWRIFAGTGNIAGDSYNFYVNGTLNTGPSNGGSQGPNGITIGRYALGNSEYSTGDFSFLLVYNTVLSATEIANITNSFRGRFGI